MPDFLRLSSLTADQMFLEILNRSLAAVPVIMAVLIARWILKKLPRRLTVALWLVVFFRLLVPFTLESSAGILPQEEVISPSAAAGEDLPFSRTFYTARRIAEDAINDELDPSYIIKTPDEMYFFSPSEFLLICCGHVWFIGMASMALHSVYAFFRLKRRLTGAMKWQDNVRLCDGIDTPFVMGVFRSKIYLPSDLSEADRAAILAHERTHIRHLDPALKLFAWLGLCLHWFNPLAWLSFRLLVQDMETACDEAVTSSLPPEERADYADALLRLSTGKRPHAATPLAFGEGDPKGRIRRIFDFRKPAAALTILAVIAVVVLSFYLVTVNSKEPHLLGGGYQVAELLYEAPGTEPHPISDMPDLCITGEYWLLYRNKKLLQNSLFGISPPGQWQVLAQFQPYPLDRSGLLELLPADEGWSSSWRPGRITDAWLRTPMWYEVRPFYEAHPFYLIFQTSAGETLLAIGYGEPGEGGQADSDAAAVHYLLQLESPKNADFFDDMLYDSYLEVDMITHMSFEIPVTGDRAVIYEAYRDEQNWALSGFTADGGIGFASYEWVDGYFRLIDLQFYPAEELEGFQLSVPGCYLAPDPITDVPTDDPEREVFDSNTYDAVFIFNEEVANVKRIVTAGDGTAVYESSYDLTNVMGEPQLLYFSWEQEKGMASCSISYHFYDIDGNELF